MLDTEVHPTLTNEELFAIREYREKLVHKTVAQCEALIYEWTRTGKLSKREFLLLCRYHFQGQ